METLADYQINDRRNTGCPPITRRQDSRSFVVSAQGQRWLLVNHLNIPGIPLYDEEAAAIQAFVLCARAKFFVAVTDGIKPRLLQKSMP